MSTSRAPLSWFLFPSLVVVVELVLVETASIALLVVDKTDTGKYV